MRKLGNTYPAMKIVRWLWKSSADNRLQAVLNTVIGLLDVAVSLGQVWAVKHAIDVACHTVEGDVIMATGSACTEPYAENYARSHTSFRMEG